LILDNVSPEPRLTVTVSRYGAIAVIDGQRLRIIISLRVRIAILSNLSDFISSHNMPHADSSLLPSTIRSKQEFWAHVLTQLEFLLADQQSWVSFAA
jgi:hypothetical protein